MKRIIKFRVWAFASRWMFYPEWELHNGVLEEIPNTNLMQFTGLYDKNGKEAFEGDIVKWLSSDGITRIDYIKFDNAKFYLCNNAFSIGVYTPFEIIGNIYETPELVEGK